LQTSRKLTSEEFLGELLDGLDNTGRQEPFQDVSAHVPPQFVPIKQIDKPHPAAVLQVLVEPENGSCPSAALVTCKLL
jgi:hypothetical protein